MTHDILETLRDDCYISLKSEMDLTSLTEELYLADEIKNTRIRYISKEEDKFFLATDEGTFPMREGAIASILNRADDTCRLISSLLEEGLEHEALSHINLSLDYKNKLVDKVAREKGKDPELCQVYMRTGRVIAAHSAQYAHIPQKRVFKEAIHKICEAFPEAYFEKGSFTQDLTEVFISLGDSSSEIMKKYRHAWISSGRSIEELERFKPTVRVCTSDTGQSGVIILPMLENSRRYLLGERLYTKHAGKNSIEDVKKNLELAFAKAQENLDKLGELMETPIRYPIPTMVRVMEYGRRPIASYAKKACEETLAMFKMMYGSEGVTAFDIYSALCEMEYTEAVSSLKSNSAIQVVEAIFRTLSLNWLEMDGDGKDYLGDRK